MIIKKAILIIIKVYQLVVSPILGPSCRFYPSCSEYARQAVSQHGSVYGIYLSAKRILKCHPFNPGGIDPVP